MEQSYLWNQLTEAYWKGYNRGIEHGSPEFDEVQKPSYNSVRDAIAPDCLHCRVHGRCSCSLNSDYCKHLFWCNKHP